MSVNLLSRYDLLNGGDGVAPYDITTGGVWRIIAAPVFPVTVDGTTYNNAYDIVPGGDEPIIDFTGSTAGIYEFEYDTSDSQCAIKELPIITVDVCENLSPGTLTNTQFDVCCVTGCVNCIVDLTAYLTAEDAGGVWYYDGGPIGNTLYTIPAGDSSVVVPNPLTVDFCGEPQSEVAPGVFSAYTFRYVVNEGKACEDFSRFTIHLFYQDTVAVTGQICDNITTANPALMIKEELGDIPSTEGNFTYISGGAPSGSYNFDTDGNYNNDTINPSLMGAGAHVIRFTDTTTTCGTIIDLTLTIIAGGASAGANNSQNWCAGSTVYMFNTLAGSPDMGGTWAETTVGPPTYGGQGGLILDKYLGTIDLTNIATGTYTFLYSVSGTCGTVSATMTIVVTEIADVTVTPTIGTCTYDLIVAHPGTFVQGQTLLTAINIGDRAVEHTYLCRTVNSCVGNTDVTVVENVLEGLYTSCTAPIMTSGDSMELLRVYRDDTGVLVDLDLTKAGPNITGPFGTVTATDLTYDGTNPETVRAATEIVVRNAIDSQISAAATYFAPTGIRYVDFLGTGIGTLTLTFNFGAEHAPATIHVGINTADINVCADISSVSTCLTNTGTSTAVVNNAPTCTDAVPCGSLSTAASGGDELTQVTWNYNSIVLGAADLTYAGVSIGLNPASRACTQWTLTATYTGCAGAVTYAWYYNGVLLPAATTATHVTETTGIYTVRVTCNASGCIGSRTISIP